MQTRLNAFSTGTKIQYQILMDGSVSPKVFNSTVQEVRSLVNENQLAGEYSMIWDGRNAKGQGLASGIYFCRLQAGRFADTIKMELLR